MKSEALDIGLASSMSDVLESMKERQVQCLWIVIKYKRQVTPYMEDLDLKHGFLSTYQETLFLRQVLFGRTNAELHPFYGIALFFADLTASTFLSLSFKFFFAISPVLGRALIAAVRQAVADPIAGFDGFVKGHSQLHRMTRNRISAVSGSIFCKVSMPAHFIIHFTAFQSVILMLTLSMFASPTPTEKMPLHICFHLRQDYY